MIIKSSNRNSEEILIIKKKISILKSLDKSFEIFGSENHNYKFHSKISEKEVLKFEKNHKITLPDFFREFVLEFGNGGCGPSYGLMKINNGVLDIPSYPKDSDTITLSNQFRFKTFWNLEDFAEDNYDLWEKEYDSSKWCDGMLRICHEGCGYYVNLVVTGKERGNIWLDARVSEQGIYPINHFKNKAKTSFFEWYLNWLDNSINELT